VLCLPSVRPAAGVHLRQVASAPCNRCDLAVGPPPATPAAARVIVKLVRARPATSWPVPLLCAPVRAPRLQPGAAPSCSATLQRAPARASLGPRPRIAVSWPRAVRPPFSLAADLRRRRASAFSSSSPGAPPGMRRPLAFFLPLAAFAPAATRTGAPSPSLRVRAAARMRHVWPARVPCARSALSCAPAYARRARPRVLPSKSWPACRSSQPRGRPHACMPAPLRL
jgi:hypothetical protein